MSQEQPANDAGVLTFEDCADFAKRIDSCWSLLLPNGMAYFALCFFSLLSRRSASPIQYCDSL